MEQQQPPPWGPEPNSFMPARDGPGYPPRLPIQRNGAIRTYSLTSTGIALGALGIIGLVFESGNHSECDGTLGALAQAASSSFRGQCDVDNLLYYLSIAGLVIGIAMVIVTIIMKAREMSNSPLHPGFTSPSSTAPTPGWYPSSRRPGFLQWWDGRQWTEHEVPYSSSGAGPPPQYPPW